MAKKEKKKKKSKAREIVERENKDVDWDGISYDEAEKAPESEVRKFFRVRLPRS